MREPMEKKIIDRYRHAKQRRENWQLHWQECFDFALPQREPSTQLADPDGKRTDKLFDGTAPDSVEQLAASLLSELTPPWARWFGLASGPEIDDRERREAAHVLEQASVAMQSQFDRSNFAIEMHQCYLDLVTAGTASLLFEDAPVGEPSAFRFTAVPLSQVAFEEGADGRLHTTYRRSELSIAQFKERFSGANLPAEAVRRADADPDFKIAVIETVFPEGAGYRYLAVTETELSPHGEPTTVAEGHFPQSPFINFRWMKAPGEVYGRSPVMKALPDIKTANKVVELTLKNASIAVTGIWQADDDGVLNPASIKLTPGTIIPKAVGSAGLTPLDSPGRFDISQLVLEDLRHNIRRALLVDKLGQPDTPKMTATEVIERSAEMARLLGATYGRLQSELLTPLVSRAVSILGRRGVIPEMHIDGRMVDLEYKSPLARQQSRQDTQGTVRWLEIVGQMGPEADSVIDKTQLVRWLGRSFGVPEEVIRGETERLDLEAPLPSGDLSELSGQAADALGEIAGGLPGAEVADLGTVLSEESGGNV